MVCCAQIEKNNIKWWQKCWSKRIKWDNKINLTKDIRIWCKLRDLSCFSITFCIKLRKAASHASRVWPMVISISILICHSQSVSNWFLYFLLCASMLMEHSFLLQNLKMKSWYIDDPGITSESKFFHICFDLKKRKGHTILLIMLVKCLITFLNPVVGWH